MNIKNKIRSIFQNKSHSKLTVGKHNVSNRKEWLEGVLKKIPEGGKILDAGAGEQQYRGFCSHLDYVCQDFAEYKPEALEDGLHREKWDYGKLDIISDIASIPRENNSFDAIMCTEVFEHIINPREAVKEFARLLKKDGFLILTAPFCSLTHFAPYHFYSGFNRFFYETELKAHGFEIVEMEANGNYFEFLAQEVNRLSYVSKRFSNVTLNSSQLKTINNLKKTLQELSEKDENSAELLCFGFHVLARKI
ncbi:bifunctional 2-polyprenyl-6-hydroxyphenol methylase/3-demethylubiquinol 3-O-methyltransferase UbiG [uncultured Winogradskyella sp.]|uniref:class I SAM-dependent methyltransferase n=1 Tax=Winogradskyella sp. 4-2091 TaxID=3381659 RepID=UPI00260866CF|nr:class I SAM-dependent methyltransferase [uncultured Winogradskyella sp.]